MLRSSNRANTSASQDNQAVTVGWNNRIEGADTTRHGPPAQYALTLPAGLAAEWDLDEGTTLDFMMGPTNTMPGPRDDPATDEDGDEDEEKPERPRRGAGGDEEADDPDVDLTVEVEDGSGRTARVTLSDYGAIRRPLETYVMRRSDQESTRFQDSWELILQTFSIPLGDFTADNDSLNLSTLTTVRFIFDRVHAGEVAFDQIGFSGLDPAFLGARVDGR